MSEFFNAPMLASVHCACIMEPMEVFVVNL